MGGKYACAASILTSVVAQHVQEHGTEHEDTIVAALGLGQAYLGMTLPGVEVVCIERAARGRVGCIQSSKRAAGECAARVDSRSVMLRYGMVWYVTARSRLQSQGAFGCAYSSPYSPYTLPATMVGLRKAEIAAAQAMGKRTTREDTKDDAEARKKMAANLRKPLPDENRLRRMGHGRMGHRRMGHGRMGTDAWRHGTHGTWHAWRHGRMGHRHMEAWHAWDMDAWDIGLA